MPLDLNGNPVEVGDVVNVAFVVKEAWGDDNFCNLILEPVESMPGSGTRQVESFNSRQVVKTPASTPVPAATSPTSGTCRMGRASAITLDDGS